MQTNMDVETDVSARKRNAHPSKSSEADLKRRKLNDDTDLSVIKSGTLLAVGTGDCGQLGLGEDMLHRKKPYIVKDLQDRRFRFAVAGAMHTCCLTDENELITFGCNDEGALGREGDEYVPETISGRLLLQKKVCQLTAGDSHCAALTVDGEVFIWGTFRDGHGSMGLLQPDKKCMEPTAVATVNEFIKDISSGNDHLLMLTDKGQVLSVGAAEQGQLGRIARYWCDRANSRRNGASGMLIPQRVILPKGKLNKRPGAIDKIFCGAYSSYVISTEDEVFAWGLNNYSQLGVTDEEMKYNAVYVSKLSHRGIQQFAAGDHHTAFLTDEGKVYTIGRGCYGRLGLGEGINHVTEPQIVQELCDISSISSMGCVTYAVDKHGSAWAWGMGTNLQLTNGKEDDEWKPIKLTGKNLEDRKVLRASVGGQHCVLIVTDEH